MYICYFFLLSQILLAKDVSHYKVETAAKILKKVKITNIQETLIQLDDSTKIQLSDIASVSSYSNVNLLLPTIAGGVSGYAGGICGLVTGTLLGFGFAKDDKGKGSSAAPWASLFTWNDNKQMPSLYIGMGLGAIYGYKKVSDFLYKTTEKYTDMRTWSVEEKYNFFIELLYGTKEIAKKLSENVSQSIKINEVVSLANNDAIISYNTMNYQTFGFGSCLLGWVGVPAAILFVEGGIKSNFDTKNSNFIKLDSEQKSIYKKSFKEKEKKLRRKSVYKTQLGCFALLSFLLMTGTVSSG